MHRLFSLWTCSGSLLLLLQLLTTAVRSNAFISVAQHDSRQRCERSCQWPPRQDSTLAASAAASGVLDIGSFTQVGADPNRPQKVNQDAFFHATFATREGGDASYTCAGVLDGHGLKGHLVSEFLAKQLPLHFQHHMEDLLQEQIVLCTAKASCDVEEEESEINVSVEEFEEKLSEFSGLSSEELEYQEKPLLHQAVIRSFHSVHWAAMQDPDIPAGRNGATCVMVVLDHTDNTLQVAHVGDSRAIQVEITSETTYTTTRLSTETTVKIDSERERMEKGEGSIRGTNVFYGPVGIAMSRSLGNAVMLRAGVVPTPMVDTFPGPQSASEYIVLGSDGIWDVLSNEAVAALVLDSHNSKGGVQNLCDSIAAEARRKWVGDLPIVDEEKVDDITCMVLRAS